MENIDKKYEGIHFAVSYSGGKDCMLAFYRAVKAGMIPDAMIITYNTVKNRSWFHGIPESVLERVSESVGVPIHLIYTDGNDYNEKFEEELKKLKRSGTEICVFGDIDIEEHRKWGCERCRNTGMEEYFPLWQENRRKIASEGIRAGFKATVTVVNTRRLDASFAGRALSEETLADMEKAGIDPCGENGEYHTFVTDGPLFSEPVKVKFGETADLGDYAAVPIICL